VIGILADDVVVVAAQGIHYLLGISHFAKCREIGCYVWYSEEGTGWGHSPPRPLLTVPNVTAHPSTASVPTLHYSM